MADLILEASLKAGKLVKILAKFLSMSAQVCLPNF
jgi:hypothetical protein